MNVKAKLARRNKKILRDWSFFITTNENWKDATRAYNWRIHPPNSLLCVYPAMNSSSLWTLQPLLNKQSAQQIAVPIKMAKKSSTENTREKEIQKPKRKLNKKKVSTEITNEPPNNWFFVRGENRLNITHLPGSLEGLAHPCESNWHVRSLVLASQHDHAGSGSLPVLIGYFFA